MPPTLKLNASGQLQVMVDEKPVPVRVQPCFPMSVPEQFFSLLDKEGKELAMISDPDELDADSRTALAAVLPDAAFTIEVTGIESVIIDIDLRIWKVRTPGGERTFETRLGTWPRNLENGSVLISDVADDLYLIREPTSLDEKSRKLLWAFSD